MHLGIQGFSGRVGKALQRLCAQQENDGIRLIPLDRHYETLADVEGIIDFSTSEGTHNLLQRLVVHKPLTPLPLLVGTTGLTPATMDQISLYSQHCPVLVASNVSMGACLQQWLAQKITQVLAHDDHTPLWIDITERHHQHKKDSPSGTALTLQTMIQKVSDKPVAIQSLRSGEVLGVHTLTFTTPYESLEITHRVDSRAVFAVGALQMMRWLMDQPQGLYAPVDYLMSQSPA